MIGWAVHERDRLLDPSCGDGRFIAAHRNSVGIEQDAHATRDAVTRAPWALVHEGDFFSWADNTRERFECAVGNPPFIRYQSFKAASATKLYPFVPNMALLFGFTSSWAPFLVAAANLLKPSGCMAFVVPAEIGHAPYAAPLLEFLVSKFSKVQIVAIEKRFSRNCLKIVGSCTLQDSGDQQMKFLCRRSVHLSLCRLRQSMRSQSR